MIAAPVDVAYMKRNETQFQRRLVFLGFRLFFFALLMMWASSVGSRYVDGFSRGWFWDWWLGLGLGRCCCVILKSSWFGFMLVVASDNTCGLFVAVVEVSSWQVAEDDSDYFFVDLGSFGSVFFD